MMRRRTTSAGRPVGRLLLAAATLAAIFTLAPAAPAATSTSVAYVFDFGAGSNDAVFPGSSIFKNALTGLPAGGTYTTADASKTVTVTDLPLAALNAGGVTALAPFDT